MKRSWLIAPFLLVAVLWQAEPLAAQRGSDYERASRSRVKGESGAGVLVYEIADFQCPYCARFATEVFPSVDSAFVETGKVQWIFVSLPLPNHAHSWAATEAALCAGATSDRFWAMHDRIYATQSEWASAADPAAVFAGYARAADVEMEEYDRCVADDAVASLILADVIFAASARVSGTPVFIINNEQTIVGLKSFEEWSRMLERAVDARR